MDIEKCKYEGKDRRSLELLLEKEIKLKNAERLKNKNILEIESEGNSETRSNP